jgi:repressor LexA
MEMSERRIEAQKEPLTDRQQQVLAFITQSIHDRGYPPTLREIGEHMKIRSTNGVNDHLKALERKGYLVREELKSRALRPVTASGEWVEIPLVGRVAAGQPILAVENIEDTVKVDKFFLGGQATVREVFALRVKGDSMIEDGIYDGDFIFVKKQLMAERGDIVVAMIDDEATVKRYYPEGEVIRFQPANSRMSPILVRKRDFKNVNIIGVVVGVYRRLS